MSISYAANAFSQTLKYMIAPSASESNSIFTQALLDNWAQKNFDEVGFQFTQVLEPSVLTEICRLEALNETELLELRDLPPAAPARSVRWLFDHLSTCSLIQKINLASMLINVCRFALAEAVLQGISRSALSKAPQLEFEAAFLRYIISNRVYAGRDSEAAFMDMRNCISHSKIDRLRILRAASQAVVWHSKSGEVSAETCRWFVELADAKFVQGLPSSNVSDWYRAKAMLPASKGDVAQTRLLMQMAEEHAREAIDAGDANGRQNLKTALESRLKEELYVRRDPAAAVETGLLLTAHDPNWPSAWAELGEAYQKGGRLDDAKRAFERAVEIGAPYFVYHLYGLASILDQLGDLDGSLQTLRRILILDPGNISAAISGAVLSVRRKHATADYFKNQVERLDAAKALSAKNKAWLKEHSA